MGELTSIFAAVEPEQIRKHWVVIEDVRYPPKQAYELISGRPRSVFTSHRALAELKKLGLSTSKYESPNRRATVSRDRMIGELFAELVDFIDARPLTEHLADAEGALVGISGDDAAEFAERFRFTEDILDAALNVRSRVGRLNDVIHASAITLALQQILEEGESINVRPSLAAGNDPSRPYDLETTYRVAEFKISQWKGADTMRKRGVFADLAHLALDESGRKAQLYVVGQRPAHFLRTSSAKVTWALGRSSPHLRTKVEKLINANPDMTVGEFTSTHGRQVEIVDLAALLPGLA